MNTINLSLFYWTGFPPDWNFWRTRSVSPLWEVDLPAADMYWYLLVLRYSMTLPEQADLGVGKESSRGSLPLITWLKKWLFSPHLIFSYIVSVWFLVISYIVFFLIFFYFRVMVFIHIVTFIISSCSWLVVRSSASVDFLYGASLFLWWFPGQNIKS